MGAGSYASNFTIADVLHDHPNAKIVGVAITMGTWNPSQTVMADELHIVTDTEDTTYDFEPTNVSTTTTNNNSGGGGGGGGGGGSSPIKAVLGVSTDDNDAYSLLQAIKERLLQLLAASYATSQNPSTVGSVLGANVIASNTPVASAEEPEETPDEISSSTEDVTGLDNDLGQNTNATEDAAINWPSYFWILVLAWLLATGAAVWRKDLYPQSVSVKAVQGAFIAVSLLLLAAYFIFGLTGAFWPSVIVAIGSLTTYFWTAE